MDRGPSRSAPTASANWPASAARACVQRCRCTDNALLAGQNACARQGLLPPTRGRLLRSSLQSQWCVQEPCPRACSQQDVRLFGVLASARLVRPLQTPCLLSAHPLPHRPSHAPRSQPDSDMRAPNKRRNATIVPSSRRPQSRGRSVALSALHECVKSGCCESSSAACAEY